MHGNLSGVFGVAILSVGSRLSKPLRIRRREGLPLPQVGNGGDQHMAQKQNTRADQSSVNLLKKSLNPIKWWFPAKGGDPKHRTNPATHLFRGCPSSTFKPFWIWFSLIFFPQKIIACRCLPNDLQLYPRGKMKYEEESTSGKLVLAWEDWLRFAGSEKKPNSDFKE